MTGTRFLGAWLFLATYLAYTCNAFVTSKSCTQISIPGRIKSTIVPPSRTNKLCRQQPPPLYMTDDAKDKEDAKMKDDTKEVENDTENSNDEKRGLAKTILLVPLFCKFVIVLVIKFVTDLIVFPLLFLYRLAGMAKRKFLRMIGKGPDVNGKQNGET